MELECKYFFYNFWKIIYLAILPSPPWYLMVAPLYVHFGEMHNRQTIALLAVLWFHSVIGLGSLATYKCRSVCLYSIHTTNKYPINMYIVYCQICVQKSNDKRFTAVITGTLRSFYLNRNNQELRMWAKSPNSTYGLHLQLFMGVTNLELPYHPVLSTWKPHSERPPFFLFGILCP